MVEWLSTPLIVIAILAVLGVGWKTVYWVASVDKDCSALKENAGKDRSLFNDFAKEIRDDIKKILRRLPPAPVAASSPPHLTEYGEQLSRKLDAVEWAKSIAPTIQKNVSGKAPFQVYDYCRVYVSKLSLETNPRLFEKAYQDGIIDEHVKNVLAIVLRDELLNRMEET